MIFRCDFDTEALERPEQDHQMGWLPIPRRPAMPIPDHDYSVDPAMEEEHRQLYGTLAQLQPVLLADDEDEAVVSQAVKALYERMARHFSAEEEVAARFGPVSCGMLKYEHRNIMSMLARLRALPYGQPEARRRLFQEFVQALARHDREIDMPIFHRRH
jgi:hemerythrin